MGERDYATVETAWIKSQSGNLILSWNSFRPHCKEILVRTNCSIPDWFVEFLFFLSLQRVHHQIPICRCCIAGQDCVLHGVFSFFLVMFSVTQLRACTEFEWITRMTCAGYAVFCVIAAEAACVYLCVLL